MLIAAAVRHFVWQKPSELARRYGLSLPLTLILYFLPLLTFWPNLHSTTRFYVFVISYLSFWAYLLVFGKGLHIENYLLLGSLFAGASLLSFRQVEWLIVLPLTLIYGLLRCLFSKPPFDLRIVDFDPNRVGSWEEIAAKFRDWWSGSWGEYLRCSACAQKANGGMYDRVATYSTREAKTLGLTLGSLCPTCQTPLEYFWSAASVKDYIAGVFRQPDVRARMALIDNVPAGWLLSYRYGRNWYPDTVAIFEDFRRRPYRYRLLWLFWQEMVLAKRRGYKRSHFRTLIKAQHITALAKLFGYQPTGIFDPRDDTREWWLLDLTWINLFRRALVIFLLEHSPLFEGLLTGRSLKRYILFFTRGVNLRDPL